MKNEIQPRIYVASLASYNAGILYGTWIDLEGKSEEDVMEEIHQMLLACPEHGEEWAIHDFELDGIRISESEAISTVVKIAELLEEYGEPFKVAFENFSDIDQAEEAVKESYQGCHKSLEDWAEQFADDTGLLSSIPENLRCYFDFERYARDAEISGDIWSESGSEGVHVFWNH